MRTFADSDVAEPRVVVFLGPSLPVARARGILQADYRPPARKGDIYGVLASGVATIVLIDGVFHGEPSIWQREILAALDEGIDVLGASSMGALRAAELHSLGMVGHGTIFEWYRDGLITGDDEVALQHADEELGYRALSEPLVNIRATLQRAEREGVLARAEADELVDVAKQTYYPRRSYRALLATPGVQRWPAERIRALEDYLRRAAVDLKASDAASVLAHCGRRARLAKAPPRQAVDLWADEFARPRLQARVVGDAGCTIAWPQLADAASRSPSWPAARRRALVRWFLVDWARLHGVVCPEAFARSFEAGWRAVHQVGDVGAWARARGLTSNELARLLAERALVDWLRVAGPEAFGLAHDGAVSARIEALLAPAATPLGEAASELAFVAAWARASGVRCPRAARDAHWKLWSVASGAARRELALRARAPAAAVRRVLEDRATAAWVLETGPRGFARSADLELAAVLELQLTDAIADLLPWQRAS